MAAQLLQLLPLAMLLLKIGSFFSEEAVRDEGNILLKWRIQDMDAKHFDILTRVSSSGKENSALVICQFCVSIVVWFFSSWQRHPCWSIKVFSSYGEVCCPCSLLPVVKLATVAYKALSQDTRKCMFDLFHWSRDECEITVLKVVFKAFCLQVSRCVWLEKTTGLPGNGFDALLFSFRLRHCIFVKVCGIKKSKNLKLEWLKKDPKI